MSALRGLRLSALGSLIVVALGLAAPSQAQVTDAPVQAQAPFYTDPNPLWRSPALIGMGRLTLGDDPNNRLGLWDFARNITGIVDADSGTTIQLRPGVATTYADQIMPLGPAGVNTQTIDARQGTMGYEVWRRTADGNAYGFYGDMEANRFATPYDANTGVSDRLNTPGGTLALNGTLPYVAKGKMRYAFRGTYIKGKAEDVYSQLTVNPTGVYLDKGGNVVGPPDFLSPTESKNTYVGLGTGVSYRFGTPLTASIGGDYLEERMSGDNTGERYLLQTTEKRPYGLGQATLLGALGRHLEWIADGKTWQASNQNRFDYSLDAGIQQNPLAGRGLRYTRFEGGSLMRDRVRWHTGAVELGIELDTWYQRVRIAAPDPSDPNSYNAFITSIYHRVGADSLALPDTIRNNQTDERGYDWSFGGMLHGHNGSRVGLEYHWLRSRIDQTTSGPGPILQGWDVRLGGEYPMTPALVARAGYVFGRWDADTETAGNEYVTNTVTSGIGMGPRLSHWRLDASYAYGWGGPDFDEVYRIRGHHQQLALQLRWSL